MMKIYTFASDIIKIVNNPFKRFLPIEKDSTS